MNTTTKTLVTALGLLAAVSGPLWAQAAPAGGGVPMALTITATATVQGPDNGADPVDKITTSTVKITTAWLLQQIATAAGVPLPKNAKLMIYNGTVYVADSKGKDLSDTFDASGVTADFDPDGTGVWSGSVNNTTSAASYTGTYLTTLSYDDGNGNSFTLGGLTTEKYSLTAANVNDGSQTGSDSITVTGAGAGTVLDKNGDGQNVIVSGMVTASGKGLANQ